MFKYYYAKTTVRPVGITLRPEETTVRHTNFPVRCVTTTVRPVGFPVRPIETPIRYSNFPVRYVQTTIRPVEFTLRRVETPIRCIRTEHLQKKYKRMSFQLIIK